MSDKINNTEMDFVRAAIAQCIADGLTIFDIWKAAEHAATPESFDDAVNVLCYANDIDGRGFVWLDGEWVKIT